MAHSLLYHQLRGNLAALLLSVLMIAGGVYFFAERLLVNTVTDSLNYHAETRIDRIYDFMEHQRLWAERLSTNDYLNKTVLDLLQQHQQDMDSETTEMLRNNFREQHSLSTEMEEIEDLFLVNANYELVYSYRPMEHEIGSDLSAEGFYGRTIFTMLLEQISVDNKIHFSSFGRIELTQQSTILVGAPVFTEFSPEQPIAFLVRSISIEKLRELIEIFIGLGNTGEVVLGELPRGDASVDPVFISRFRNSLGRTSASECDQLKTDRKDLFPMPRALRGEDGIGWQLDNSCQPVFAIWKSFPEFNWGMVIKQDEEEIMVPIADLQQSIIYFSCAVLILLAIVIARLSSVITRPLIRLNRAAATEGPIDFRLGSITEVNTLAVTLVEYKERVDLANKAKDDFLASMSHELRTPLTAIIGNSEYLLGGGACGSANCMEPDALGVLGSIKSAGEMQLVLVNDILDASKIDSGKFTIEEGAYDLKKMLKRVEDLFLFKTKEAGLGFTLHQQQEETHQLIGDGQRIGQILTNLVSNAIKFTASGDVILRSRREGERLIFEVEDSGIGMSAEGSAKLFNRFEQADGSISKRFGGSGLGLYISLNLAELMGGSIEVLSEEGVGSTFTVVLPYQQSDKLVEKGETDHTALQTHQTLKGTVLIAEDVALLQQLVRRMLEKIGVSVTLVENGKEAVEQVQQHTFDLVLMDMQMPIMESYGRKWCSGS